MRLNRARVLILGALILTAGKLWLVSGQHLTARSDQLLDHFLFVRLADFLQSGQWLGPYDLFTLVKGPFYPFFIAVNARLGFPLLVTEHLFYLFACLVLLLAVQPLLRSPASLFTLYVVLLFNPFTYNTVVMTSTLRCAIYPALTLWVLACAIGMVTAARRGRLLSLFAWALGLGVALSAFWLTREEGVWLLPSLLLLMASVVWLALGRDRKYLRLVCCLLPVAILLSVNGTVVALNKHYYGIATVIELQSPAFLAAYGALSRVKPSPLQRYYPVPRHVRERVYQVSPAFSELRDYLEGQPGWYWSQNHGDGSDIAGGWFFWALRSAADTLGYHADAHTAQAYYQRIADEVNSACEQKYLECGPPRATLSPVWHSSYVEPILGAFWRGIWFILTIDDPAQADDFSTTTQPSSGPREGLDTYARITHERLAPAQTPALTVAMRGWAFSPNQTIELQLINGIGERVKTIPQYASPDVYSFYREQNQDYPNAQQARFNESLTCFGCLLQVVADDRVITEIPLDGSVLNVYQDHLQLRFEHLRPATTLDVRRAQLDQRRTEILAQLGLAYHFGGPFVALLALLATLRLLLLVRRDTLARLSCVILLALLGAVLARIAVLAAIDATSFKAIRASYLSPAYPPFLVFCILSCSWAWRRKRRLISYSE